MRGDGQIEVELVEEDLDEVVPTEPGWVARVAARWAVRRRRPPWPVRRWGRLAGCLAVVVAGAVVAQGAAAADRRDRLATVPGLVASLVAPPVEVWRTQGVAHPQPLARAGDLLLVQAIGSTGAVVALDWADGTRRWSADVGAAWCQVTERARSERPDGSGLLVVDPQGSRLVCIESTWSDPSQTSTTLRVLDVGTGAEVDRRTFPGIQNGGVDDGEVLLHGLDAEGRAVVLRWSIWWEQEIWRQRSEQPIAEPGGYLTGYQQDQTTMTLVGTRDRSMVIDMATGRELPQAAPTPGPEDLWIDSLVGDGAQPFELPDGATAQTRLGLLGGVEVAVLEADGSERFAVEGYLLRPEVDDGSSPEVLLIGPVPDADGYTPAVVGVDARTGDERWRLEPPLAWGALVRLDGMVVVTGDERLSAVRLGDGVQTWSVPAGAWWMSPRSDGERLIVLEDEGRTLVARGLHDGAVWWRVPLGAQAWLQPAVGGDLMVVQDDAIARWSPGGSSTRG